MELTPSYRFPYNRMNKWKYLFSVCQGTYLRRAVIQYFFFKFWMKTGLTVGEILPTYSRELLNVSSMAFWRETFYCWFDLNKTGSNKLQNKTGLSHFTYCFNWSFINYITQIWSIFDPCSPIDMLPCLMSYSWKASFWFFLDFMTS